MNGKRWERLKRSMEQAGCEALIVSCPANIYYLTGFTGEGVLWVGQSAGYIITDGRYLEQAEKEAPGAGALNSSGVEWAKLAGSLTRIGFESNRMTYREFEVWQDRLEGRLIPAGSLVEELRAVKDAAEIENIRRAVAVGDQVFLALLEQVKEGQTETEVAALTEYLLRTGGCEAVAFPTIAVSGPRSSLPHGVPTDRRLQAGEFLTLDFGGFFRRYAGDMTRTVAVTRACSRMRGVYHRVLEAQLEAVARVEAGATCRQVDEAARGVLKKYALDEYFVHSTGHGVGLEVHEFPGVSGKNESVLQENMVITIEPGVYIPSWGGVRIEDVVLVKNGGREVLTASSKDLIAI